MITQAQYKHAGKMLSVLDMNSHEELYQKYLEVALDYEIDNGYYCSNFRLNNSLICQHQTVIPRRSAGSIILICELIVGIF
ncbi:hypothetical protein [Pantoea sp. CFSAN033090]|uniref:hypothetical protein n=1 Tax=Pantoea sp. CFSAN033090 TaxID=1690502 RepID=UPI00068B55E5|nr:hypothetical protein [Pantoea sp. CFSAN033090]KOA68710.1 hypothetical protein AFL22_19895 [Pantoea sp. CFSAN033090]